MVPTVGALRSSKTICNRPFPFPRMFVINGLIQGCHKVLRTRPACQPKVKPTNSVAFLRPERSRFFRWPELEFMQFHWTQRWRTHSDTRASKKACGNASQQLSISIACLRHIDHILQDQNQSTDPLPTWSRHSRLTTSGFGAPASG